MSYITVGSLWQPESGDNKVLAVWKMSHDHVNLWVPAKHYPHAKGMVGSSRHKSIHALLTDS